MALMSALKTSIHAYDQITEFGVAGDEWVPDGIDSWAGAELEEYYLSASVYVLTDQGTMLVAHKVRGSTAKREIHFAATKDHTKQAVLKFIPSEIRTGGKASGAMDV